MINITLAIQEIEDESERDHVETLYLTYSGKVKGLAYHILGNETDAEDALTETFMRIIRYREKFFSADVDETHRLLVIYTRSACFDLLRKKKHIEESTYIPSSDDSAPARDIPDDIDIPAEIIKQETAQYIKDAVMEMGEPASLVVMLRYYHGMKNKDIAKMLGLNQSTVGTILSRSLKTLRKKLEEYINGKDQ